MNNVEQRIQVIERVIFGDEKHGDKGMKIKVDEMHEILVGLRGIKGLFGLVIMVGLTLVTIKTWIIR